MYFYSSLMVFCMHCILSWLKTKSNTSCLHSFKIPLSDRGIEKNPWFKYCSSIGVFRGWLRVGIVSEPFSPNKFSAAGHLSAVNSLEQELELNTLAVNCSSVIRLTLAGYFLHSYYSTYTPESWLQESETKRKSVAIDPLVSGLRNLLPWHLPMLNISLWMPQRQAMVGTHWASLNITSSFWEDWRSRGTSVEKMHLSTNM